MAANKQKEIDQVRPVALNSQPPAFRTLTPRHRLRRSRWSARNARRISIKRSSGASSPGLGSPCSRSIPRVPGWRLPISARWPFSYNGSRSLSRAACWRHSSPSRRRRDILNSNASFCPRASVPYPSPQLRPLREKKSPHPAHPPSPHIPDPAELDKHD